VVPKEAPRTSSPAVLKLLALAVAVVVVVVVAWTVLHLVFAVLHLIELGGVALIAGYLGWLLGVHHGHRTARRP
jgi:energy-coupling factor transporter transmembrane protein EcfT